MNINNPNIKEAIEKIKEIINRQTKIKNNAIIFLKIWIKMVINFILFLTIITILVKIPILIFKTFGGDTGSIIILLLIIPTMGAILKYLHDTTN